MKTLIIVLISIFSFSVYSQTVKNRLFFYGGFHSSAIKIEDSDVTSGNLTTNNSTSPYFEVGYEYYISDRSGLSLNMGFVFLTKDLIILLIKQQEIL